MQEKFILSIDQSTSGTKAVLFTKDCKVHNRVTINHAQIHPCPGWVEHNPDEIIKNVKQAIIQVINESSASCPVLFRQAVGLPSKRCISDQACFRHA
jgi:glycerol kinase